MKYVMKQSLKRLLYSYLWIYLDGLVILIYKEYFSSKI